MIPPGVLEARFKRKIPGCNTFTLGPSDINIMHGLSSKANLSFLVEKTLQQVCIGFNEAILHFGDDISITIMCDVCHRMSNGDATAIYKSPVTSAGMLVSFMHSSITNALIVEPGTLILEFSNEDKLEIYDSNPSHESYVIKYNDNYIVV